ncbi:MAG: class I SAM-dependent methyltransferase, partial [Nitrosopumilaceae archaeon]
GYFQETLRSIKSNFCLGFIDCDLGESAKFCAKEIWPRLVDGGLLFFHDYEHPHFKNMKPVVDAFVKKYEQQIEKCEQSGVLYSIKKKK